MWVCWDEDITSREPRRDPSNASRHWWLQQVYNTYSLLMLPKLLNDFIIFISIFNRWFGYTRNILNFLAKVNARKFYNSIKIPLKVNKLSPKYQFTKKKLFSCSCNNSYSLYCNWQNSIYIHFQHKSTSYNNNVINNNIIITIILTFVITCYNTTYYVII